MSSLGVKLETKLISLITVIVFGEPGNKPKRTKKTFVLKFLRPPGTTLGPHEKRVISAFRIGKIDFVEWCSTLAVRTSYSDEKIVEQALWLRRLLCPLVYRRRPSAAKNQF